MLQYCIIIIKKNVHSVMADTKTSFSDVLIATFFKERDRLKIIKISTKFSVFLKLQFMTFLNESIRYLMNVIFNQPIV